MRPSLVESSHSVDHDGAHRAVTPRGLEGARRRVERRPSRTGDVAHPRGRRRSAAGTRPPARRPRPARPRSGRPPTRRARCGPSRRRRAARPAAGSSPPERHALHASGRPSRVTPPCAHHARPWRDAAVGAGDMLDAVTEDAARARPTPPRRRTSRTPAAGGSSASRWSSASWRCSTSRSSTSRCPSIRSRARHHAGDRAVGGLGLRAGVRADPGRRRPARRRLRPAPDDADRADRLHRSPAPPSALAPNVGLVIVARLVQGAAAGLLTPQNSGLIQQLFRGAERGRAFGFFGLTVVDLLGARAGARRPDHRAWPARRTAGAGSSWSTSRSGWSRCVAIRRMVPRRAPRDAGERRARLDLVGAGAARPRGAGLLLPAGQRRGRRSGCRCSCWCSWSPLLVGFVRWERRIGRRGGDPLLDVGAAAPDARLRQRAGRRRALLHRLHRDLPGAVGVPPGRARLLAAGRRAAAHAVRARLGADRAARRPAGLAASAGGSPSSRWR